MGRSVGLRPEKKLQHYAITMRMMKTLILFACAICIINASPLKKRQAEESNNRALEFGVHLTGEIVGELVGEQLDEVVVRTLSEILGIEHEESKDPLIHPFTRALGKTLGK